MYRLSRPSYCRPKNSAPKISTSRVVQKRPTLIMACPLSATYASFCWRAAAWDWKLETSQRMCLGLEFSKFTHRTFPTVDASMPSVNTQPSKL